MTNCGLLPWVVASRNMRAAGASFAAMLIWLCLLAKSAPAQTFTVLHQFNPDNGDGYLPEGSVILDSQGNLYGTAADGGLRTCVAAGCGVVWELTPNRDGSWTENLIHEFDGSDGDFPAGALIFDQRGNLYGTEASDGSYGLGTIFELTPGGGAWTESTLHQFTGGWDGAGNPGSVVSIDNAGHIYGSTSEAGIYDHGVVFALTGPEKQEIALHAFTGGEDGATPTGPLTFDANGNIYGTASAGGLGYGVVFKLSPNQSKSGWTETILYAFTNHDAILPSDGVIFDAAGNLYGTTPYGGEHGQGAVYKLTHQADGSWSPSFLYSFAGGYDGEVPYGGVVFDGAGNLYGTTTGGGLYHMGTVYKLTPAGGGTWTETILHKFTGDADGSSPEEGVILDSAGNVYGTTPLGGLVPRGWAGVVFEITP
jgi:uncharacterized repeat protein (TIGR03803 family)